MEILISSYTNVKLERKRLIRILILNRINLRWRIGRHVSWHNIFCIKDAKAHDKRDGQRRP